MNSAYHCSSLKQKDTGDITSAENRVLENGRNQAFGKQQTVYDLNRKWPKMDLWKMTDNLWKMADNYELDMENCRQSSCMITLNDHFTILASSLCIYHTPSFSKDYFLKQIRGKTGRLVYSIKGRFCYIQASLIHKMQFLLHAGHFIPQNADFASKRHFTP